MKFTIFTYTKSSMVTRWTANLGDRVSNPG